MNYLELVRYVYHLPCVSSIVTMTFIISQEIERIRQRQVSWFLKNDSFFLFRLCPRYVLSNLITWLQTAAREFETIVVSWVAKLNRNTGIFLLVHLHTPDVLNVILNYLKFPDKFIYNLYSLAIFCTFYFFPNCDILISVLYIPNHKTQSKFSKQTQEWKLSDIKLEW